MVKQVAEIPIDLRTLYRALRELKGTFYTEREMCDFIEARPEIFCREILGVEMRSFEREYVVTVNARGCRNPTIDFLFVDVDGNRVGVECKNTKDSHRLADTIGQALSYLVRAEKEPFNRMVILSAHIEPIILGIIEKFNLPLEYILFRKDVQAIWAGSQK